MPDMIHEAFGAEGAAAVAGPVRPRRCGPSRAARPPCAPVDPWAELVYHVADDHGAAARHASPRRSQQARTSSPRPGTTRADRRFSTARETPPGSSPPQRGASGPWLARAGPGPAIFEAARPAGGAGVAGRPARTRGWATPARRPHACFTEFLRTRVLELAVHGPGPGRGPGPRARGVTVQAAEASEDLLLPPASRRPGCGAGKPAGDRVGPDRPGSPGRHPPLAPSETELIQSARIRAARPRLRPAPGPGTDSRAQPGA